MKYALTLLVSLAIAPGALAGTLESVLDKNSVKVIKEMEEARFQNVSLTTHITSAGIVYYDAKANVLFHSTPMEVKDGQFEALDKELTTGLLSSLTATIEYKADNERAVMYQFSDITCSWCAKAHSEIPRLNEAGVTVVVIPFSRMGADHVVAKQTATILNAIDPKGAMAQAFAGAQVPQSHDVPAELVMNQNMASILGVTGTPASFLNGVKIDGYLPSSTIISAL
ncbi:hypothetical protein A6E01_20685 (plasmid) [Vibrio breoganii]|uniref:Thioredoxin-like fold domain-containing protein n=1 Tax=Vibrio breoganii TaxID=553239 RepID=A0AAN1CUH6_9VIBR|nr:thioredoxin fold domain-containing protein [Vibrio breoganii]ANO35630.1 hypothetical protein A6E01_20685 [Vibrio breoganii]